jgi:membrane-associated phospholipid phosphatase
MTEKAAKIISIVFHPFLIPILGFLVLFNTDFYFSVLSGDAKRFVLLVVFFTTAILPTLSVAVLALNPKFNISMENMRERVISLLMTGVYYYLGFQLLNRIRLFPVFKMFLIASVLVIVLLLMITLKWKISTHMASVGALAGTVFALSFRSGMNPLAIILGVVLISGLVGSARLFLNKHTLTQIAAGYGLGFLILYFVLYFI